MPIRADWTIAIIGAGISGASAGQQLARNGASVTIFDKGRGPGGRCTTRRFESYRFDHGAQYLTAHDPRFLEQVAAWAIEGTVARWKPRIGQFITTEHTTDYAPTRQKKMWVGTPGMSEIGRSMLKDLATVFKSQITSIQHTSDGWLLTDQNGESHSHFDQLLITVPAPQLHPLLGNYFDQAKQAAMDATVLPCWSMMLAFDQLVDLPFDACQVADHHPTNTTNNKQLNSISWLARNSHKPERMTHDPSKHMDCWVIQAHHDWSRQYIELTKEEAAEILLRDFNRLCKACSISTPTPSYCVAHRWRYALAKPPLIDGFFLSDTSTTNVLPNDVSDHTQTHTHPKNQAQAQDYLLHSDRHLAIAGDWLSNGRIENAWLSGVQAAEALTAAWFDHQPTLAGV